jgi:excinuclease ABC subunit A
MGPEGGSGGGTVIAESTPEQLADVVQSYTGQFLGQVLSSRTAAVAG